MLFKRKIQGILGRMGLLLMIAVAVISCKPAPKSLSLEEPQEKQVVFPELDIQGIIYDKDNPIVVIDGDVRKIGDVVREVEVVSIAQQYVQLRFQGKTITMNVKEPVLEVSQGPKLPDITVEGIIFDKKSPLAIINGDVKKTGDIVLGALILEIASDRVVLQYNNEILEKKGIFF